MSIRPVVYSIPSFVSGATFTSGLEIPGVWVYTYLVVPTMSVGFSTSSTPVYIRSSVDGVTYYRYTNSDNTANTLVVGVTDLVVASSVSQRIVPLNNFAGRYIQLEVSGTGTQAGSAQGQFSIICVSNQ